MRSVRVTISGATTGSWIPVDQYLDAGMAVGLFVASSGAVAGTYSVEVTPDDVFNTAITPVAFASDPAALTNASANQRGAQTTPVKAVRFNNSVNGAGAQWIFTVFQEGAR